MNAKNPASPATKAMPNVILSGDDANVPEAEEEEVEEAAVAEALATLACNDWRDGNSTFSLAHNDEAALYAEVISVAAQAVSIQLAMSRTSFESAQ